MGKLISSPFFIFLLILILIGIVTAAGKESYRRYQMDKEIASLKEEIKSLAEKHESLSVLLDYFNSEKSLEKEARLKLNLLKEGERLIIISSEEEGSLENQASQDIQEEEISNFEKWLEYLGLINL